MAYVPGFQYDVFISYARRSDRDGWASAFYQQFLSDLAYELGVAVPRKEDPKPELAVFLDVESLEEIGQFPPQLKNAARNSALLIPLLGQGYLQSGWCHLERKTFLERTPDGQDPASCIAPIVVQPVEFTQLDDTLRQAQVNQRLLGVPVGSPEWRAQISSVAKAVAALLRQFTRTCRPVYIGPVPPDREELRRSLAAELAGWGYQIVPRETTAFDSEPVARDLMSRSALAVHFAGVGEDLQDTRIQQVEWSVATCPERSVLYQPIGFDLSVEEEFALTDQAVHFVKGKALQELTAFLRDLLQSQQGPEATPPPSVAIVCQPSDFPLAAAIQDSVALRQQFRVGYPSFLNSRLAKLEELRQWKAFVADARLLLFCWGASEEAHLKAIEAIAAKQNPEAARHWFLAAPDLDNKRTRRHPAIVGSEPFDYTQIEPLLNQLRAQGATA